MVSPITSASADFFQSSSDTSRPSNFLYGASIEISANVSEEIISSQVPVGVNWVILGVFFSGTGWGRCDILSGSRRLPVMRTSHSAPSASWTIPVIISASENLRLTVTNETIVGGDNTYEAWIFYREEVINA